LAEAAGILPHKGPDVRPVIILHFHTPGLEVFYFQFSRLINYREFVGSDSVSAPVRNRVNSSAPILISFNRQLATPPVYHRGMCHVSRKYAIARVQRRKRNWGFNSNDLFGHFPFSSMFPIAPPKVKAFPSPVTWPSRGGLCSAHR